MGLLVSSPDVYNPCVCGPLRAQLLRLLGDTYGPTPADLNHLTIGQQGVFGRGPHPPRDPLPSRPLHNFALFARSNQLTGSFVGTYGVDLPVTQVLFSAQVDAYDRTPYQVYRQPAAFLGNRRWGLILPGWIPDAQRLSGDGANYLLTCSPPFTGARPMDGRFDGVVLRLDVNATGPGVTFFRFDPFVIGDTPLVLPAYL